MTDYKNIGSYKVAKKLYMAEVVGNLIPMVVIVGILAAFVGIVGPTFMACIEGLTKALSVLG